MIDYGDEIGDDYGRYQSAIFGKSMMWLIDHIRRRSLEVWTSSMSTGFCKLSFLFEENTKLTLFRPKKSSLHDLVIVTLPEWVGSTTSLEWKSDCSLESGLAAVNEYKSLRKKLDSRRYVEC